MREGGLRDTKKGSRKEKKGGVGRVKRSLNNWPNVCTMSFGSGSIGMVGALNEVREE